MYAEVVDGLSEEAIVMPRCGAPLGWSLALLSARRERLDEALPASSAVCVLRRCRASPHLTSDTRACSIHPCVHACIHACVRVCLGGHAQAQGGDVARVDVPRVLKEYQNERLMRVSMIHGMAGMAAFMASTYKCYLGESMQRSTHMQ